MSDWPSDDPRSCLTCERPIRFTDPGHLLGIECEDCALGRNPLDEPRTRRCPGCAVELSRFVPGEPLCETCEAKVTAKREAVLRRVAPRWPLIVEAVGRRLEERRHGRDDDAA